MVIERVWFLKSAVVLFSAVLLTGCLSSGSTNNKLSATETALLFKQAGILENVTDSEIMQITEAVDAVGKHPSAEILVRSGKAVIFEENKTIINKPEDYAVLFAELTKLNPQATVSIINSSSKQHSDWKDAFTVFLALSDGRKIYETEFFQYLNKPGSGFYRILNRLLADRESEYRFYSITFYKPSFLFGEEQEGYREYDGSAFGIVSLTKDQAKFVSERGLLDIHQGDSWIMSTEEMTNLIKKYEEMGLFTHLDEKSLGETKKHAMQQTAISSFELLTQFPNTTYCFDTETSNLENPYEEETIALADISRGNFKPTNIVDGYDYEQNKNFSFAAFGRNYSKEMTASGDWLDTSFIDLINNAVSDGGVDGRFYSLKTETQDLCLVFFSQSQFETFKREYSWEFGEASQAVEEGKEFEEKVRKDIQREMIWRS